MSECRNIEREIATQRAAGDATPPHALPGDRPQWPRDRVVDVRHILLELKLDVPGKAVAGTATHTVTPINDGLRQMTFDAVEMRIDGVTLNRAPAKYQYDGDRLTVDLGGPRRRGDRLNIAISYAATPRLGLYFIAPDHGYPAKPTQVWSQGQDEDSRYWYPCYDYPNEKQTSEMVVTVPGTWFALSNGRMVKEKPNRDGTKTFHWLQDRPHSTYLITLAAGEFARIDGSRDGLTIDYYVEPKDVASGELTFKDTPAMIALFEQVTGVKYPWAKYSQVVVRDFVFGGMENTSATTMTENILMDRKGARDFTTEDLVAHELAHMWFGDLMTCRDWSHGWLNESFATYLEMLWDEERHGRDEYLQGVAVNTDLYLGERYRRPIVTNVYNEPIDIFDRHLYEKGSVVLHTLRGVLGDDQFFRSIRRYCADNQERSVITQDLASAIEAETGRNMDWFFDQWVYRTGHPKFEVTSSWDGDTNVATVTVKQVHSTADGTPIFRVPLTIDFRTGRKRATAFKVEVTEKEHTFHFPLAEKPDLCRFDPYSRVLKELDFDKSAAELRLQLQDDDDSQGRIFAASSLGKKGGPEAVAALEAALMHDRFWGVQAAAAKALGVAKGDAARDALLRSLSVRHLKAKRAVVAALGEFRDDARVFAALEPIAARDRSWFVEAEANRSIGKLRAGRSYEALLANMGRPSLRQVVRVGCIDGLVELRDERGIEVLIEAAAYGSPWQARPAAVGAIARLGQFFEGRKKELGEALAGFFHDPDFRVRMAAANAFRTLKDPSQIDALDAMARRELDGRAIRAAREVAGILRKGDGAGEEVRNLRDDVEKLRDDNAKLRERLDKLEAKKR